MKIQDRQLKQQKFWADRFKKHYWADQFKHKKFIKQSRKTSLIPIPMPPKIKVGTKKLDGIQNANVVINALATPPDTFYAGEKLKKAYKDKDAAPQVIAMRVKLPYDGKFLIQQNLNNLNKKYLFLFDFVNFKCF